MNVLVTGHTGFFGNYIAEYFLEKNHNVFGVSRSIKADCKYNQYSLDITDNKKLCQLVREKCIDLIVHAAAKPIVADCDSDPYNAFTINSLGTASVLESARQSKCKKVIIIETDKVYGNQGMLPTTEDAPLNPNSPYELSKALGSQFCDFYRSHYNMDVVSVRPVNLFGPNDFSYSRIIPAAMRSISLNKGIPLHSNGDKIYRTFLYVKDATKMVYLLATNKTNYSTYNLSSQETWSIKQLADNIADSLDYNISHNTIEKPGDYNEIDYQFIDGSRFIKEFNFTFTPFKQAIKETYASYSYVKA